MAIDDAHFVLSRTQHNVFAIATGLLAEKNDGNTIQNGTVLTAGSASTVASTVDIIMNKPPSIPKHFKTVNYEGDTGWEVKSIVTDTDTGAPIGSYITTSAAIENTWQDLIISGFKKRNSKYYSLLMNASVPNRNEIIYGEQMSGVKGFFNKLQFSIADTAQKELFAVSSDYELLTN